MAVKIDFIDHLLLDDPNGLSPTTDKTLIGCNGGVFYGKFGSWARTSSASYDDTASEITTVAASQNWYVVDGAHLLKISGSTGAVTPITTGGAGQPPSGCRLVTLFRNRLVLSRTTSDSQNWFMSKVGDYTNFDFTDEADDGALDGNASDAGTIQDAVTCLAPHRDEYMVMGYTDSVWIMHGDPRAGGRIDSLARGGGIIGPWAYAHDPEGNLYYLGRTSLMVIAAGGGVPQNISRGRLARFLSRIDFSVYRVHMAWSVPNNGLWIFFTPASSAATTHLYWDRTTDSFYPQQLPAAHGPTCVRSLIGEVYEDRQLLLGCFDGFVRTFQPNWTTDDGTAINSYAKFGPIVLADQGEEAVINEVSLVVGVQSNSHFVFEVFMGQNPQDSVADTSASLSINTTDTGRVIRRDRMRGNTAVVKISNSAIARRWTFEQGYLVVKTAGRIR